MSVAIVGGTGDEGFGLAVRLAAAGVSVTIGSRAEERAREAAGRAREAVGSDAPLDGAENPRLVAGFHTVSAEPLTDLEEALDADVLLCGDDAGAKAEVGAMVDRIPGARWVDCGALSMARVLEPITAALVSVNRKYGIRGSGVRLTGRDAWGPPAR